MPHDRFVTRDTLSSHVSEQLPEFVRFDHPTFVAFIEAYYEFLETQDQALNISFGLRDLSDIDDTLEEFVRQFKETYLLNFPEVLAFDSETGRPLDERRIIKNIKAYYKAKGSEKSYKFLFRILFDTNVEFFFPKVDILRASDGKFIIERFMRVTTANGPETFEAVGGKIRQRDRITGEITASAKVDRAIQFQSGLYEVTEFVISEIFGDFEPPQRLQFDLELPDGTTKLIEENIFTVVISIDVVDGGTGFVEGEVVRLDNAPGDVGIGALGVVDRVDGETGAIIRIAVRDQGTNYLIPPIPDFSESENGTGASATVNLGPIFTADGFFGNNDGKLSSNKFLQDSFFFQDYSYVLKTEVTIDKWLGTVKKVIHPAGLKVFGEVTIFRCVENESPHETRFQAFEIPLIGHYTPYTFLTVDDLASLYPIGFDRTNPQGSTWILTDSSNFVAGQNLLVGETVTGQTSGDTAVVVDFAAAAVGQPGSVLSVTGAPTVNAFQDGEVVLGATSGFSITIAVGGREQTPTVAEDGTDGTHATLSNPAAPGDFTSFPDLLARPTLALGSGSGPFFFSLTGISGTFQIGQRVSGGTTNADAFIFSIAPTGTQLGLIVLDGEFAIGETLSQITGPAASATISAAVGTTPIPKWGFPYRPKADPIFIIYHHPNRRGMREIPGPGEPHPNANMRVIDRTMLSGTFTTGESVIGDLTRITDITAYLTSLEITDSSNYVAGEDFIVGETVTGQTSGETATVVVWSPAPVGNPGSVLTVINESGAFSSGEIITGATSGFSLTENGQVTIDADFDLGETVTGQTSGATGVVLEWNPVAFGQLGSELVLGQITGTFADGEDIVGSVSTEEITVDEITEVQTEGIIDADELPTAGESQVIMFSSGEFQPGEIMTGQTSGATALVDSLSSLIYVGGMPFRDIVIRDFARNMPVGEEILCRPRDDQEILSDAGFPNSDIGGLDGTGPSE